MCERVGNWGGAVSAFPLTIPEVYAGALGSSSGSMPRFPA